MHGGHQHEHASGSGDAHGHAHGGHVHAHGPARYDRAFAIAIALNVALVLAQAVGGVLGHSLALIADAGHNLSDVLALVLAWGGTILARRAPTLRRTYGLRKSSILASLINAAVLLVAVGAIAWEAIQRLAAPETVATGTVAWIGMLGVVVNTATALLFMRGRAGDLNVRGAFMHMAADAAVSAGVVVAAVLIRFTGWRWLDPAMSLVIVVVITVGTWSLLIDSLDLAMDAVPAGIDRAAVEASLAALPGVREVHDLHIWGMSTTEAALTAHLVVRDAGPYDGLLAQTCAALRAQFGIGHATIQIETGDPAYPCELAPADAV